MPFPECNITEEDIEDLERKVCAILLQRIGFGVEIVNSDEEEEDDELNEEMQKATIALKDMTDEISKPYGGIMGLISKVQQTLPSTMEHAFS